MTSRPRATGKPDPARLHRPWWLATWQRSGIAGIVIILAGFLFALLTAAVVDQVTQPVDEAFLLAIHAYATPALTLLALTLAVIGDFPGLSFQLLILTAGLWRSRYRRVMLFPAVSLVGGTLLAVGFKLIFQRPRPLVFEPFVQELSYSFPSGHATMAVCFYGALAVLAWRFLSAARGRAALVALLGLMILAIGASRLYLGVHYPSDVLGGFAAGAAWMAASALVTFRFLPAPAKTRPKREEGPSGDGP